MAKAKAKKSSGKSKKGAGKSLPKAVRKSGLMDLMNSELGRQILADALVAAAGAAAAALTRTRTARKAGAAVAEVGSEAAEATKDKTLDTVDAVAGIVTEAARHFLPTSLIGKDDETEERGKAGKKVKYVHRSSDHSKRKVSKAKADKPAKQ